MHNTEVTLRQSLGVTTKHSRIWLGKEFCGNGGLALQEAGQWSQVCVHKAVSDKMQSATGYAQARASGHTYWAGAQCNRHTNAIFPM